jgi:hypothetical protein
MNASQHPTGAGATRAAATAGTAGVSSLSPAAAAPPWLAKVDVTKRQLKADDRSNDFVCFVFIMNPHIYKT